MMFAVWVILATAAVAGWVALYLWDPEDATRRGGW